MRNPVMETLWTHGLLIWTGTHNKMTPGQANGANPGDVRPGRLLIACPLAYPLHHGLDSRAVLCRGPQVDIVNGLLCLFVVDLAVEASMLCKNGLQRVVLDIVRSCTVRAVLDIWGRTSIFLVSKLETSEALNERTVVLDVRC